MIYFENVDGRVCILFPYLGRVLLGSTDIRVDEPGDVRCEDDEVDYILKSLSYVFPGIAVRPEHIVYRYSGVRPLPRSDASFTGRISRDHFVARDRRRRRRRSAWSAANGRRSAPSASRRPTARWPSSGCRARLGTEDRRIGGGVGFPADEAGRDGADRAARRRVRRRRGARRACGRPLRHQRRRGPRLLPRRGTDTPLARLRATPKPSSATSSGTSIARTLADLLQRRTSLAITGALSSAAIAQAAAILADELGWTEQTGRRRGARVPRRCSPATTA